MSAFQYSTFQVPIGHPRENRKATIGSIVFSDPDSRNSFRLETAREFAKLLLKIEKSCDALFFEARGRVFCSGGNLSDHQKQGAVRGRAANREIAKVLSKLNELKIPTLALVDGDALGGGVELLSAFDVVIASPHVLLGFWQRRLGLAFGWGGGARLAKRLGGARLSRAGLEARALTAEEAREVGLIDIVVARHAGRAVAEEELGRLVSWPLAAVSAFKASRKTSAADARSERGLFEKLWFAVDHRRFLQSKKTSKTKL